MSTKEKVYSLIDDMTEEQLEIVITFIGDTFRQDFNEETKRVLDDVKNGRNMSRTFNSVEELWEDLNADD